MIKIRKSHERGHANHGWLDTWHTFSFASYQDPGHMGFRTLRVINEDYVEPSRGFGTHPHENMEIITYVLDGAVQHQDSMGNGSVIRPGEVQRMSAGTGVTHSEVNPSDSERLHLLQIWILPEKQGLEPGYEQRAFPQQERAGKLRLVASRDGSEGSVTVHQDVKIFASILGEGETVEHSLPDGRHAWVQVARGSVALNDTELEAGDGAALSEERLLRLKGRSGEAELLIFELP